MKNIQKSNGFTLIELVVVIVILGILAATAAPKFIDLTGDAKTSVMQGVQGSINSAINLANAKALVSGETGATGEIVIGGEFYALINGYPSAAGAGTADGQTTGNGYGISELLELDSETPVEITIAAPALFKHQNATDKDECVVTYTDSTGAEIRPEVTVDFDKC
ncbi:pilus assembly FimT family protein [Thalassotalea profundi]|uniref:Type II secretion system protein n=1 Tax=Thalassotalea profundi TaxID=2036687 RepID=A0ABQ3IZE5_9GAMM|nr:type II secretion system protein [Thalassotalea profundi]GHE99158.1 hypothetical protein GCM10011501_30880 [Thalassotalea profundi]